MKPWHFVYFATQVISVIFGRERGPLVATIIIGDACNLSCSHCAVNNLRQSRHPFDDILHEMRSLYREGARILFFCGGETMLWSDGEKTTQDLVRAAKKVGFLYVNVVTNGTISLNIPEADIVLLSIDGVPETHDQIRGQSFDQIAKNLAVITTPNICVYTALNKINHQEIESLVRYTHEHPKLKCISFNFHTPYPGTEHLALTKEEKQSAVEAIKELVQAGYPILNLPSALDRYISNRWARPCRHCIVSEDGQRTTCGRCINVEGLCDECGYLFAVEYSLLFAGNLTVIWEALSIYLRYL